MRVPSGKISTASPRARIAFAVSSMSASPWPRRTGKAPSELRNQADQPVAEQLLLGDVVHRPPGDRGDHERIQERAVVGGEDHGPALGHVLAAEPRQPEVEMEERLEDRPHEPVDERVDAALAVARVQLAVIGGRLRSLSSLHEPYPRLRRSLQWPHGLRRDANAARRAGGRRRRGRMGRAAAARQARVRRGLRRCRAARAPRARARARHASRSGLALHVANGAVFGAVYANVAPSLPVPGAVRGAAAGLAEHLATWPRDARDRPPLARPRLPQAVGRRPRAFAQATWRHVLFGALLGELERRLNPPESELEPDRRRRRGLQRARLGRAPGRDRVL